MGNCLTNNQEETTISFKDDYKDETAEFSKSLADPENGCISSPKARFARKTSAHRGVMSSIAMKFPAIRRA